MNETDDELIERLIETFGCNPLIGEVARRLRAKAMTTEQHIALRDAHHSHDSDAYFAARAWMLDTVDRRKVFEAGFQRGFEAGKKVYGRNQT